MDHREAVPSGRPEQLDHMAFAAYFLGAVFPLVALAVVVQRYVLPEQRGAVFSLALIGLVVSLAALSLSAFLLLRRSARAALAQMDQDNHRLGSLLDVSGALANAEHAHEAASTAAGSALRLASASAAYVFVRSPMDGHPVVLDDAGDNASEIFEAEGKALTELASLVIGEARPALRGPERESRGQERKGGACSAVVPLPGCVGDEAALGALAVVHTSRQEAFDASQVDALSTLGALAAVALRNTDLRDAQRNFFAHVTEILVSALDAHLDYHRGHGKRVAALANRMGRELGLDDNSLQRLHFAAMLHDIGMLKLDRTQKMNTKACEMHTSIGGRMLGGIRLWENLAPIVSHHHEWFDGTGYPEGLAGEDIPFESRIIAVCDAYDTMTSDSSYKVALTVDEALAEFDDGAGTQFDPELVELFASLVERGVVE